MASKLPKFDPEQSETFSYVPSLKIHDYHGTLYSMLMIKTRLVDNEVFVSRLFTKYQETHLCQDIQFEITDTILTTNQVK